MHTHSHRALRVVPSADRVCQLPTLAQLHNDVYCLSILQYLLQVHHIQGALQPMKYGDLGVNREVN